MEIELTKCECCGLSEECTQHYILEVRSNFGGRWLCGLCSEAVRDEVIRRKEKEGERGLEEAVNEHMSFCRMFRLNPAVQVADGLRQMLRRRSNAASKV